MLSIKSFIFSAFLMTILICSRAWSYPEFISYGYASCLTCHYNGHGGGPLNDYGRALWSAEIASKYFYAKNISDEQIGARSGFLGETTLARWLRPDIKYRGVNVISNPGSKQSTSKYYNMQNDFGLTFLPDEDGRYLATITWGNMPRSSDYGLGRSNSYRFLAREYYVRIEVLPTWWFYAGLMEKVFGIRNIDHTSFQRGPQGFGTAIDSVNGINSSQGVVLHKLEDTWEAAFNYFIGHPYDQADYRQSGASLTTDFEVGTQKRIGISGLSSKSNLLKKDLVALHYRQGLSKGSSLLFEYGMIQDKGSTTQAKSGNYNMLEGFIQLGRGYNLKLLTERYISDSKAETPEQWKWGVGMLAFPAPRFEIRLDFVHSRQLSEQGANQDAWSIQQQLHISL